MSGRAIPFQTDTIFGGRIVSERMDKGGRARKRLRKNGRDIKRTLNLPGRKLSFKVKPKPGTDGVEESQVEVTMETPDGKTVRAKRIMKND